jgi:hypothetical protein
VTDKKAEPVPLSRLQKEFPLALAALIQHVYASGYQVAMGEAYVADTDSRDGDYDGPHRKDGGHYRRTACDLMVYDRNGVWLKTGAEPIWADLGRFWCSLHPQARWTPNDANHFGFIHNGVF